MLNKVRKYRKFPFLIISKYFSCKNFCKAREINLSHMTEKYY